MELIEKGKRARSAYEEGPKDPVLRRALHSELNILRYERRALTYSIRLANAKQRTSKFQGLVPSKPKLAHKLVNGKLKDRVDPQVLRQQGSDTLLFKSEDDLQETQTYFEKLNSAPYNRTHTYQPNISRNYPWQEQNALDHFDIETHVGREGFGFMDLDDHIKNPVLFQQCLRNTKLGKTPGSDGVCNEILRYLPEFMQQAIHKTFILMWMTGHTPDHWKQSHTLLLYKKGDPLQLSNYRPIALANTLYKVWTGVLTQVMSMYAEHFHLLSDCQEGLRKHRNTMRALQSTLNVFEDAKLHQKIVFAPYTPTTAMHSIPLIKTSFCRSCLT